MFRRNKGLIQRLEAALESAQLEIRQLKAKLKKPKTYRVGSGGAEFEVIADEIWYTHNGAIFSLKDEEVANFTSIDYYVVADTPTE